MEEQDAMLGEYNLQCVDGLFIERLRQVEAVHLAAAIGGHFPQLECLQPHDARSGDPIFMMFPEPGRGKSLERDLHSVQRIALRLSVLRPRRTPQGFRDSSS